MCMKIGGWKHSSQLGYFYTVATDYFWSLRVKVTSPEWWFNRGEICRKKHNWACFILKTWQPCTYSATEFPKALLLSVSLILMKQQRQNRRNKVPKLSTIVFIILSLVSFQNKQALCILFVLCVMYDYCATNMIHNTVKLLPYLKKCNWNAIQQNATTKLVILITKWIGKKSLMGLITVNTVTDEAEVISRQHQSHGLDHCIVSSVSRCGGCSPVKRLPTATESRQHSSRQNHPVAVATVKKSGSGASDGRSSERPERTETQMKSNECVTERNSHHSTTLNTSN